MVAAEGNSWLCFCRRDLFLFAMAKPALGRGLDKLMREDAPAPPAAGSVAPAPASSSPPANLSPGVASLLRRPNGHAALPSQLTPAAPAAHGAAKPYRNLIRASLVVADVFLLGLALWLIFRPGSTHSFWEILLAGAAVLLGAWLSLLAFWF